MELVAVLGDIPSYLENMPYELFYEIITLGKLKGQDLFNICETCVKFNRYCSIDNDKLFTQLLDMEYGIDNKINPRRAYTQLSGVKWNNGIFNKNRSTILLVNISGKECVEAEEEYYGGCKVYDKKCDNIADFDYIVVKRARGHVRLCLRRCDILEYTHFFCMFMEKKYPNFRLYMRPGDIIVNSGSGAESYMYDGFNIIEMNTDLGFISVCNEFVVFDKFIPDYWDQNSLNINNMYYQDRYKTSFTWHRNNSVTVLNKNIIIDEFKRNGFEEVKKLGKIITIDFEGQVYDVILNGEFIYEVTDTGDYNDTLYGRYETPNIIRIMYYI